MLKRINISESEISHILSLHNRLNENVGFIIGGKVLSKDTNEPVYNVKVSLRLGDILQKQVKTNSDGEFTFNDIQPNTYSIFIEGAELESLVNTNIKVSVVDKDLLGTDIYLESSGVKTLSESEFISVPITVIDFIFVDEEGLKLPKVEFSLYDDKNQLMGSYNAVNGKTTLSFNPYDQTVNGETPVTIQNNKQYGFFYTNGKFCTVKKNINIVTNSEGFSESRKIEPICLKNGLYNVNSTKEGAVTIQTPRDTPKKKDSLTDTNIIKISLSKPKITSKITISDKKNIPIVGSKVNLYGDENKERLIQTFYTNSDGNIDIELTTDNFKFFDENGKLIPNALVYYEVSGDGHETTFKSSILNFNDNNDIKITLPKIKPKKISGEDLTIGAYKTASINGDVKYGVTIGTKTFEDLLPNVFIRMTNNRDNRKFFEVTSDADGLFQIENVSFGSYNVFAIYGDKTRGLVYENKDFNVTEDVVDFSIVLTPNKGLQNRFNNTIESFKNKKLDSKGNPVANILAMDDDGFKKYISSLEKIQMNSDSWIKDLLAGRFEKKYGEVTTKESCLREFKDYANVIRKIYNNEVDPNLLKNPGNNLQPTKQYLKNCVKTYKDKITNDKDVKLVINPPGIAYDYGIRLENKNKQDIYTKDMRLSNTIAKVITEHSENKKRMIQESKILNNRFKFIVENYNLNRKSERELAFQELRKEKNNLIRLGHDKNLVKESFIDVMKGLFGNSGQDPVIDFKKGLSEKLSSPIDLKVLVNEMDASIIENAFKTEEPKEEIMNLLIEKIKEKIEPQVNVVFDNINKKMDDFRSAVGGLQV